MAVTGPGQGRLYGVPVLLWDPGSINTALQSSTPDQ